jgi:hypothetical protein
MTLYSMRSPDIITKFDRDGNVQSSYHCSGDTCDCPAGQRPTCRHRQMWPQLRRIADSHWFLDWDGNRQVVDFNGIPKAHYDRLAHAEQDTDPLWMQQDASPAAATLAPVIYVNHTVRTEADLLTGPPVVPAKSWRRI